LGTVISNKGVFYLALSSSPNFYFLYLYIIFIKNTRVEFRWPIQKKSPCLTFIICRHITVALQQLLVSCCEVKEDKLALTELLDMLQVSRC